ncbi:MAG TPA: DUF1326 domain-containing protein [Nitrososphaera sp.]|jgi:hypothetical protein|nr:DUF1326 domain-containing protein [Nitrososphaera sp.]
MASDVPSWTASGDWFDVCSCTIPCPCIFAQAPTNGECEGVLAYHIKKGRYGEIPLDGLNTLGLSYFKGNIWAGDTKASFAFYIDERADDDQRRALQQIFSGKAGGFMANFANLIEEVRGSNFAPIKFEVADDLASWSATIPGKVAVEVEALTGPMTPPGKRVQTLNAPGSEVGPGTVATWGKAKVDEVNAPEVRFSWKRKGNSSKHIPFNWTGP